MSMKRFFAELAKVEDQDDGTIKVFGFASTESEDMDGEVIKADAIKAALPGYMKWGAVREMHQPKAAGTAIEAEVREDGTTWFGAHVVDSEAVKKVKAGVYKGFSVGGRVTGRDEAKKSVITGINLIEVSLVDRPANPEAVITMYKADDPDKPAPTEAEQAVDELAEMLKAGTADPIEIVRLLKAAKEAPAAGGDGGAPDGDPGAAGDAGKAAADAGAPAEPETVKKGMWGVARFADLLQTISGIVSDADFEAQYEQDNSPLPEQLREWLKAGAAIFAAMAQEEVDELLAQHAPKQAVGEPADLAKGSAPAAQGEPEDLRKVVGELAELVKGQAERLEKQDAEIKALKAQPAPGKAVLRVVDKSADVDPQRPTEPEPVRKSDGSIDEVASEIKKVHASGGRPLWPSGQ